MTWTSIWNVRCNTNTCAFTVFAIPRAMPSIASIATSARARRSYGISRRPRPGADWKAAEAQLQPLWDEVGPAGHAYEDFYWQAAEAILREEWQAITSPASR